MPHAGVGWPRRAESRCGRHALAIVRLGGKTARQTVRSARGRERVDALLKSIEYGEATLPLAERFDVSALRRSLGL